MARIFGLVPIMWSRPVSRRSSRRRYPASFFSARRFGHLLNGRAQLVEQPVALDHVTIRAEIHRGNRRVNRGHAGNQNEKWSRAILPSQ